MLSTFFRKILFTTPKIFLVVSLLGVSLFPNVAGAQTLSFLQVFRPISYTDPASVVVPSTSYVTDTLSADLEQARLRQERVDRLDGYFAGHAMPLAGYGAKFVAIADKCDIDWRLLPAIAVRESSGGKHQYNNNPFGWGSAKIRFDDFNAAIETVSDNLCGFNSSTARYYKDKTTYERLWSYNGSVLSTYPKEVIWIMESI